MAVYPLHQDALYRRCDTERFDFQTTAEVEELDRFIGQERVVRAVRFGIRMRPKIRCGALHRANGGYLILDALKLLLQPSAWESLKRVLYSGEIRMESLAQIASLISTVSLEPEPIPLNAKIIPQGGLNHRVRRRLVDYAERIHRLLREGTLGDGS